MKKVFTVYEFLGNTNKFSFFVLLRLLGRLFIQPILYICSNLKPITFKYIQEQQMYLYWSGLVSVLDIVEIYIEAYMATCKD